MRFVAPVIWKRIERFSSVTIRCERTTLGEMSDLRNDQWTGYSRIVFALAEQSLTSVTCDEYVDRHISLPYALEIGFRVTDKRRAAFFAPVYGKHSFTI